MNSQDYHIRIGIIDCGSRDADHLRVFDEQPLCEVGAYADLDHSRLERLSRSFPQLHVTNDYRKLLADDTLTAVVITASATARAQIAKEALQAGKHVFVKAPSCTNSREAGELSTLADTAGLVLMVGHTLLFDDTTAKIRELITSGELGRIRYLDAVRTGLGPLRTDVNALYDLGTHDVSICNHLLSAVPVEVSALGSCLTRIDHEDVCFVTLKYAGGTLAHIHVSRLNPRASSTLTVVGERRTVHWDTTRAISTLCLYDTTPGETPRRGQPELLEATGGEQIVRLLDTPQTDPLARQVAVFVESVRSGTGHSPGTRESLNVTKVLEAATRSMKTGGGMCPVETTPPTLCKAAWASVDRVGILGRRQAIAVESNQQETAASEDSSVQPSPVLQ